MYFDDRLATVLRTGIGGDRALRTQFRQLLDLLGTLPDGADGPLVDAAFARLALLSGELPAALRGNMIREPGLRLVSARLIATLATQEIEVASAAMAAARLPDSAWQALIPNLPLTARGFLRHRRDLGDGANAVLQQLGVIDMVLPGPEVLELSAPLELPRSFIAQAPPETPEQPAPATQPSLPPAVEEAVEERVKAAPTPAAPAAVEETAASPLPQAMPAEEEGANETIAIGTLVRRIEAFQRARNGQTLHGPRAMPFSAPPHEGADQAGEPARSAFDFATDANGRINWSEPAFAPMAVGLALASEAAESPAQLSAVARTALRQRQPLRGAPVAITGAPAISGTWRIDAYPRFDRDTGHYLGHYGRMRRMPPAKPAVRPQTDQPADRMRQILHELRTPVNAIQGFAEIIQQQLYGPAPHEYRALAATIASDAARILAGFDELDRLARLESGALELDEGQCDIAAILAMLTEQIRPALLPRSSEITVTGTEGPLPVPMAAHDAERLCWRLMATLAGEASAGEEIALHVTHQETGALIAIDLPASLAGTADIFSASLQGNQRTISAGMFGSGFTLRLARAEARAVGGDLAREGDTIHLCLPLVNGKDDQPDETRTGAEPTGAIPA